MGGNYAKDAKGFIWDTRDGAVRKVDSRTGKIAQQWKTKRFATTYGSALSHDGRYFGGGAWPRDGMVVLDTKTGEMWEPMTSPDSAPARGGFDPYDNYWAGRKGGPIVEFEMKTHQVHEYNTPGPFPILYSVTADKNGEIWAGESAGRPLQTVQPQNRRMDRIHHARTLHA